MAKINLKKFSIYEFELSIGGATDPVSISVVYKKDEENSKNSTLLVTYPNGHQTDIPVELFTALNEALNEIDPYGFVFSDLEGEE